MAPPKKKKRNRDRKTDIQTVRNTEEGHGSRKTRAGRDSEIEKQRDHQISPIYGVLKKWYKETYLQNRYRVRDTENELVVTKVKGK